MININNNKLTFKSVNYFNFKRNYQLALIKDAISLVLALFAKAF